MDFFLRGEVVKMKLFFHLLSGILLFLLDHGVFGFETEEMSVFVNEGDSVTLNTGVEINQQEKIKWYCNGIRMAQISGDLSSICTDVQCNKNTERFRDRLKLDHQTGSLTIMNTTTEHTGHYQLHIISSSISEGIFNVFVRGVSAAERDKVKRKSVKEGESVTLDPGVIKNTNDLKTWYFNEIPIAEIRVRGDQSKICTDVQCNERFRGRLKLDHQTGSLTIMNTRTTDSGDYKLQISSTSSVISISYSIIKSFIVTVTASGLSSGVIVGIYSSVVVGGVVGVSVLLVAAATCVIYYCCRSSTRARQNDIRIQRNNQENRVEDSYPNANEIPLMDVNVEHYFWSPIQYQ